MPNDEGNAASVNNEIRRLKEELAIKDRVNMALNRTMEFKCNNYESFIKNLNAQLHTSRQELANTRRQFAQKDARVLELEEQLKEREDSALLLSVSAMARSTPPPAAPMPAHAEETIANLNKHIKMLDADKTALEARCQEFLAKEAALHGSLEALQRENGQLKGKLVQTVQEIHSLKLAVYNSEKMVTEAREEIMGLTRTKPEWEAQLVGIHAHFTRLIQPFVKPSQPDAPQVPDVSERDEDQTLAQEDSSPEPEVRIPVLRRREVKVLRTVPEFLNEHDPENSLGWKESKSRLNSLKQRLRNFNARK